MDKVASAPVDLTGDWVLDRHASDDVRARLLPVIEKTERRWRQVERKFEDDSSDAGQGPASGQSGGPSPNGASRYPAEPSQMQWMRQMRHRDAEALIAFISPATQLEIRQSIRQGRQEITVHNDKQEGTRTLVPGETSSLFIGMGSFVLSSGWQKTRFVVDMRGTGDTSMHITQYYTLLDAGAQMEMRMEARIPELGKQEYRFLYNRSR